MLFNMFPSPIYGASFKQFEGSIKEFAGLNSFRPLYTGLVSNPVPWNPRRYWAENAVCG